MSAAGRHSRLADGLAHARVQSFYRKPQIQPWACRRTQASRFQERQGGRFAADPRPIQESRRRAQESLADAAALAQSRPPASRPRRLPARRPGARRASEARVLGARLGRGARERASAHEQERARARALATRVMTAGPGDGAAPREGPDAAEKDVSQETVEAKGDEAKSAAAAVPAGETEEGNFLEKIPSAFFAMPFALLMRNFEWTPESVNFGQIIVMTEALACLGALIYIESCIDKNRRADKTIWIRPQQYKKTPEDKKEDPFVEVSEVEFEKNEVWEAQKSLFISAIVALAVPRFLGFNQPILLQSIIIPVSFLRSKLFLIYIMGFRPENPWNAVSEEVVQQKAPEAKAKAKAKASKEQVQDKVLETLPEQDRLEVKYGVQAAAQALETKLGNDAYKIAKSGLKTDALIKFFQETVKNAIEADLANVQHKETQTTLLMALSRHCYEEVVPLIKDLLQAGADPLKADIDGWNALHWASFYVNLDAARALLEHDASADEGRDKRLLEAKTIDGSTALDIAKVEIEAETKNAEALVKLLESISN